MKRKKLLSKRRKVAFSWSTRDKLTGMGGKKKGNLPIQEKKNRQIYEQPARRGEGGREGGNEDSLLRCNTGRDQFQNFSFTTCIRNR